jgi:hypothetical protein
MGGRPGRLALLLVAAAAVALGVLLARRAPGARVVAVERPAAEALAREIAALDQVYAAPGPRAGEGAEYYRHRRAALLDRLVEAQAVEERSTAT